MAKNIDKNGPPGTKRWTAIDLMRKMKGHSAETICRTIYETSLYESDDEAVRHYNWAIRECYVEGCAPHPGRARHRTHGAGDKSMRRLAIEIMRRHADKPMVEVLDPIAKAIGRSVGEARSFYRYIVTHGMAPGQLESGWTIFSEKYVKPRTSAEAVEALRRNLASPDSDREVVNQLMRDVSNFEAMDQLGNSYVLKMHNGWVSQKAADLMDRCLSFDDWHELTTNEHSTPVSVMKKQIVDDIASITDEKIKAIIGTDPVCTLTNEEDAKLTAIGSRSLGTYQSRYKAAGIQIVQLPEKPYLHWVKVERP
jgi:hypothetical protein